MTGVLPQEIIPCLQGVMPACIVTCSLDGTPNTTLVSQVWYVDPEHVALSFQFFNKTIRNIRANPNASVLVYDPADLSRWELRLLYIRTETSGPVFDEMEVQLEAIASMTGMSGIFHLKGADIYRVKSVRKLSPFLLKAGEAG